MRRSRLSQRILSSAVSVAMAVDLGLATVRNVLIGERNSRIGNVVVGLTENLKVCRSNVALLCS